MYIGRVGDGSQATTHYVLVYEVVDNRWTSSSWAGKRIDIAIAL